MRGTAVRRLPGTDENMVENMEKNRGLSFYKRKKKISPAHVREVFSWIFGILTAVFIALVLNVYLGTTTSVVGVSMEPSLYNGPQIFINSCVLDNDEYFCMGDNPGNSEDSRSANIGPVKEADIIGKVWFRAPCEEAGMGFVK